MKIGDIREISNRENGKDILVEVNFDHNITNRWELVDPVVAVSYSKETKGEISYMEVLDRGVNVHGFEISEEEEKKILNYLREENII